MKCNLKKKIKQHMKQYDPDYGGTFVILKYPDPDETELVGACNLDGVVV